MIAYVYILGTILFTIYGQMILKFRMAKYGSLPEGILEKIYFLLKLLIDPFIFSGFFSAFLASLFWMAAMTKLDLSYAYPMIVGGLVIITSLLAVAFFKEPLSFYKVVGLVLISIGVYLVSKA